MGRINTSMLISAITCLVAAMSFTLPWAIAHFGKTTETATAYGVTIIITLEAYDAYITGLGTGGAEPKGQASISGLPYSFDVNVDVDFTHDMYYVGWAGFAMNIVAFVLILVASLMGSPAVGRGVGYVGFTFLAIGLGLGLSYLGVLWAGLGKIEGKGEVEVSLAGYGTVKMERDLEADLSEFIEDAEAVYPGYGFILALVMWVISVASFVKGMLAMSTAIPSPAPAPTGLPGTAS